jgi:hypothetical protein
VYLTGLPVGPFKSSIVWDSFYNVGFQRYGQLTNAGSLVKAGSGNTVQVYYPTSDTVSLPKLTLFPPRNTIYKMIFAIVMVGAVRER